MAMSSALQLLNSPAAWPSTRHQRVRLLGQKRRRRRGRSSVAIIKKRAAFRTQPIDRSRIAGMLQLQLVSVAIGVALVADTAVSLITAHYSDQSVTCCQLRGQPANVMGEK